MENPRLSFTPGARRGRPVVGGGGRARALAHSWSGNLVTNATWDDFWLNEGITTYVERRIDEALYGREYATMQDMIGIRDMELEAEEIGEDSATPRCLSTTPGATPTRCLDLAYEKGALFMRMMRTRLAAPTDRFSNATSTSTRSRP
jgi:aminopeptidase N